jgi:hypothetical protein
VILTVVPQPVQPGGSGKAALAGLVMNDICSKVAATTAAALLVYVHSLLILTPL